MVQGWFRSELGTFPLFFLYLANKPDRLPDGSQSKRTVDVSCFSSFMHASCFSVISN